jgi:hypothetical protein
MALILFPVQRGDNVLTRNPEASRNSWALGIRAPAASKCLPMARYELGTPSRINSQKD